MNRTTYPHQKIIYQTFFTWAQQNFTEARVPVKNGLALPLGEQ